MKNMKKVLFLLLFLVVLGAININGQVRIGGDEAPNAAAVLDLNVDDDATPTGNKGALALPRVNLDDNTAQLNGTDPIAGMLVYNTNADMTDGDGVGVYYWDGSQWVNPAASNDTAIADGAVTTEKLADASVTATKIAPGAVTFAATSLQTHDISVSIPAGVQQAKLTLPAGCTNKNSWIAGVSYVGFAFPVVPLPDATGWYVHITQANTSLWSGWFRLYCFH